MSKQAQFSNGPVSLAASDLKKVAGGYDDGNWCGTMVPRFPFPWPPQPTFDQGQVLTVPVLRA